MSLFIIGNDMNGRECMGCPGHVETFIPGKGRRGADVMVIADTGSQALHKLAKVVLKEAGIAEHRIYYTSAVPCKYGGTAKTSVPVAAWRSCRGGLLREIKSVKPKKILCMGSAATSAVLGERLTVKNVRGRGYLLELDDNTTAFMVPTFSPKQIMASTELFRDFAFDVQKLADRDEPMGEPTILTRVAQSVSDAKDLLATMASESILSFDLETIGTNTVVAPVTSFGLGARLVDDPDYDTMGSIIPGELYEDPAVRKAIGEFFREYPGILVTHNGPQFDYAIMTRDLGFRVRPKRPRDTMLMNYVLDERPSGGEREGDGRSGVPVQGHSLKTLSRVYFDAEDYHFDHDEFARQWYAGTVSPELRAKLHAYHGIDLHYTLELHDELARQIEEESPRLWSVHDNISVPAAFVFGEIEMRGARVDKQYFINLQKELEEQIGEDVTFLKDHAKQFGNENFNPASPQQVAAIIYDHFGFAPVSVTTSGSKVQQGQSSRTTERLALFTHKRNAQRAIDALREGRTFDRRLTGTSAICEVDAEIGRLESFIKWLDVYLGWKQRLKAKSTYIDSLLLKIDANDRIHPEINLTGTSTGRTSYRGYNLQNIPALTRTTTVMGKKVRDGFVASPGHVLIEADFSQAELRTAAWLSQDERLIQVYNEGKDFHTTAASAVFKKPESEILGYERHAGKFVVFGIIYGRGAQSLCSGWEMDYLEEKGGKRWTVDEAQTFLDNFLHGFPGFEAWQKEQHRLVVERRYIEILTGRRRRVPFIANRSELSDAERRAVNTPIQGLTSELCLLAVVRVHNAIDPDKAWITHTVHDSINLECREDYVEECVRIIKEVMPPRELRHIIPDAEPGLPVPVPFTIDVKTGTQWGSMGDYSKKVSE